MGEAHNKIRIFSLAKELGLDSKVLIKHCNDAGVPVKSSALAAISPEEKQIVLDHLSGKAKVEKVAPAKDPLLASRESTKDSGARVRNLRDIASKDRGARSLPDEAEVAELELPEATDPVPTDKVVAAELVTPEAQPVEIPESVPPTVSVASPELVSVPPVELVAPQDAAVVELSVVAESQVAVVAPDEQRGQKAAFAEPIRRELASSQAAGAMRDMRPLGSGGGVGRTGRAPRPRIGMPVLAAMPAFKPKEVLKPVVAELKPQKPDIRLAPGQWDGQQPTTLSPLGKRLHKQPDDDKKPKPAVARKPGEGDKPVEAPAGGRGRGLVPAVGVGEGLDAGRKQRRARTVTVGKDEDGEEVTRPRFDRGRNRRKKVNTIELKTSASIELPITVRGLSEAIGRPAKAILGSLFKRGEMVTINQIMDEDVAWEIAAELGVELEIVREKSVEEDLKDIFESPDDPATLQVRPPIVTILGHVDHGKTTLLDKIRSTDVAAGEAGGITQHIRAYQVDHNGHKITFVDTPGHAAFGQMRARGANSTDIVVLVVASNDSVMPQTIECIAHAKAAGVPIIVAMNKSDLNNINEQRVLTDLANNGIQAQEWGGEIEVVRTSGTTGAGIETLLETILLTAEISEFKANPKREAVGACLEGFRSEGVGPIAWLIVQKGTLRVGDVVLCGSTYGRIRAMYNDKGEMVQEAPPSTPVKVTGLSDVPGAGDRFYVLHDQELVRSIADDRRAEGRAATLAGRNRPRTLDDILNAARDGLVQDLNLIIKADSPGSIEALRFEIAKIEHPEVRVRLLHAAVGGVNESDISLASASDAVVIAFHVIAEDRAKHMADQEGVDIRRYDIIYEVADHIKHALEGLLTPEEVRVPTGRAIVLQTFTVSRTGTIAGCRVLSGAIERSHRVNVIRDQKILRDYGIASLRRIKDDVKEVRDGMECGIRLEGFNDIKDGDLLEAFRIDIVKRTLD